MRLNYKDIINKHKGQPCFVALHGPSLTKEVKKEVQNLQLNDQMLRISVNNWFDFFDVKPDYWVVSNGEFTIKNSMMNSMDEYFDKKQSDSDKAREAIKEQNKECSEKIEEILYISDEPSEE